MRMTSAEVEGSVKVVTTAEQAVAIRVRAAAIKAGKIIRVFFGVRVVLLMVCLPA